jgi:uncharacterized membrane protein YhaH (DUF805 family)
MNSFFAKYFSLSGKSNRKEFLQISLVNIAIIWLLLFLLSNQFKSTGVQLLLYVIFGMIETPIAIRRCNHLRITREFALLTLIPYVSFLIIAFLLFKKGESSDRRKDANKNEIEKCPHCNSENISADQSNQILGSLYLFFGIRKTQLLKYYKCFECEHTWYR